MSKGNDNVRGPNHWPKNRDSNQGQAGEVSQTRGGNRIQNFGVASEWEGEGGKKNNYLGAGEKRSEETFDVKRNPENAMWGYARRGKKKGSPLKRKSEPYRGQSVSGKRKKVAREELAGTPSTNGGGQAGGFGSTGKAGGGHLRASGEKAGRGEGGEMGR